MGESQLACVKCLTREAIQQRGEGERYSRAVHLVSHYGMTPPGQVDSDLVGSSRLQGQGKERCSGKSLEDAKMGHRLLASSPREVDRIPPGARFGTDKTIGNRAGIESDPAPHQGPIFASNGVRPELLGQNPIGGAAPGKEEQAGSLPIDPVQETQVGSLYGWKSQFQVSRQEIQKGSAVSLGSGLHEHA